MQSPENNSNKELLFHYTKLDTALFHILPSQKLLLNPFAFTNDIYETDVRLSEILNVGSGDGIYWYLKENKIKILCLVHDGKVRGFDNQLMWSFYGEKYQGVCLIFDKKKLLKCFKNDFGNYGRRNKIHYKLKELKPYSNPEGLNITGFLGKDYYVRNFTYDKNSHKIWKILKKTNLVKDIFFRKTKQWIAEYEYRFLVFDENQPTSLTLNTENLYLNYMDSLVGVVVGPKFNKKENNVKYNFLVEFANNNKIKIYESKYDGNKIIPNSINSYDFPKDLEYEKAFLNEEYL